MKNLQKNTGLLLATLLSVLIFFEVIFSVIISKDQVSKPSFTTCNLSGSNSRGFPQYDPNQNCFQCYQRLFQNNYSDMTQVHEGENYNCILYQTGRHGFRSPPIGEKKTGRPRVIFIGDSFTFGEGVKGGDIYPQQIQKLFNIESINIAMQGLNTSLERSILENFMYLNPDLVVLGYVLNDTMPYKETIEMQRSFGKLNPIPEPLQSSNLASFVYKRIKTYQERKRMIGSYKRWFEKEWKNNKSELLKIRDISQKSGAKFLMVLFPMFIWNGESYPLDPIHKRITQFAEKNDIQLIDMKNEFHAVPAKEYWVHPLDQHPNVKAHKVFADRIGAWIKNNKNL
jgi:hypothetical protein